MKLAPESAAARGLYVCRDCSTLSRAGTGPQQIRLLPISQGHLELATKPHRAHAQESEDQAEHCCVKGSDRHGHPNSSR
jgi:hypothetical protein